jgi:hypothetical protein
MAQIDEINTKFTDIKGGINESVHGYYEFAVDNTQGYVANDTFSTASYNWSVFELLTIDNVPSVATYYVIRINQV